jgi:predicted flap endonuclease-1-like 5' DNA nuclease
MAKLEYVEGIGEKYAQKLREAGVTTTEKLLDMGSTSKGRADIAEKTGVSEKLILEWVNHVDLFRIKGVGQEYADLLEESGVDTVPELAQRNPENLYAKMVEVNSDKKLVRSMPTQQNVSDWVAQAKALPRVIQY